MKKIIYILLIIFCNIKPEIHLRLITDKVELNKLKSFVVHCRLDMFKEYPYLYDGNIQEANEYFDWFANVKHAALAVAYDDDMPIGFVSGASFVGFNDHFIGSIEIFKKNNISADEYYYLPEVIILPKYRNLKLTGKLFNIIEKFAKDLGYKFGCFVTEEHAVHPLKPKDYKSSNTLWTNLGYIKTNMNICHNWLTLQIDGTKSDQEHKLIYWIKNF